MAEVVLYRKWRPQTFAEVAGQRHVVQTLTSALASGKIAHAYLFCGPRGTGKTTVGRILAKAVNCLTTGGKEEPCDRCSLCQDIRQGRATDLIEIDAASNRGIDEIRDLREKVRFAPLQARYKVYIIDEVHMLTEAAFNALLKTLEEPPPHTLFVLATTEAHKVPATIISRCQRFDFHRLPLSAIVQKLAQICSGEDIQADEPVLRTIARSAGGSLRDATNLLEQLSVAFGQKLELEPVQSLLGMTSGVRARALGGYMLRGDVTGGLKALGQANEEGIDLRQLQRELVEFLRGVLLAKSGAHGVLDVTQETMAEMKALAATAPVEHILKAIKLVGEAELHLDSHPTLALEMALVECSLPAPAQPGTVGRERPEVPAQRATVPPRPQPSRVAGPRQPAERPAPARRDATQPAIPTPINPRPTAPVASAVEPPAPTEITPPTPEEAPVLLQQLKSTWSQVIEGCRGKGQRFKFDGLLRSAEPVAIEGDAVVIGFNFPFHMEKVNEELDNPVSRKVVEDVVARALGRRLRLRCILSPKAGRPAPKPDTGGHLLKAALEMGAKPAAEGQDEALPF